MWSLPCRVRSLIIQQEKAQDREKLLLKFIKIMKVSLHRRVSHHESFLLFHALTFPQISKMQHLRKLNNFNSYLAILSALDSAPIRRLEWQKQTSEVRDESRTFLVVEVSVFESTCKPFSLLLSSGIGGILHID